VQVARGRHEDTVVHVGASSIVVHRVELLLVVCRLVLEELGEDVELGEERVLLVVEELAQHWRELLLLLVLISHHLLLPRHHELLLLVHEGRSRLVQVLLLVEELGSQIYWLHLIELLLGLVVRKELIYRHIHIVICSWSSFIFLAALLGLNLLVFTNVISLIVFIVIILFIHHVLVHVIIILKRILLEILLRIEWEWWTGVYRII
jgi:hypothetical protein